MDKNVKIIAHLGMGIALYVALGMAIKVPLVGNIQTDLGYVAFGAFLYAIGWPAFIVGMFGACLESIVVSGWVPVGWMAGQALVGLVCGAMYKKTNSILVQTAFTIVAMFLGIAVLKTGIECFLYGIPLQVKFFKNVVAFVADTVPMLIGLYVGRRICR